MRWRSIVSWFGSLPSGTPHVYGINRRNVDLIHPCNERRHRRLVDDKIVCKERLTEHSVPVPETLLVCRGLFEVDRVGQALKQERDFVVKPARGSRGRGILVVDRPVEAGWLMSSGKELSEEDLHRHLANIVFGAHSSDLGDQVLIERRVVPHAFLRDLWAEGVCDIRILALNQRPVMAMLRIPTRRSEGRSNLHQGGIGVGIDLDSGTTTRAVCAKRSIERHPETDSELLGLQIPGWKAVLEVAKRASGSVPLGYLGVDITIDERQGPLVLELNARPGLEIQNVNGLPLERAIEQAIEQRAA